MVEGLVWGRGFSAVLSHFFQMSRHKSRKEVAKKGAEARWASSEKQERRTVAGFAGAVSSPEGLLSPSKLTKKARRKEKMKKEDELALKLPHRRTVAVAAVESRPGRPPAPTPALRCAISSIYLLPKSYFLFFVALMMKFLQSWAALLCMLPSLSGPVGLELLFARRSFQVYPMPRRLESSI